ncbi:hypothetical protein GCM10028806_56710 [Spirosoma terrae]|uniref:Phosphoribosyltransferase domain-containing protein n=1 Tax=Spirosoma terrae TaxID=1968276 RepID=A0A6L9LBX5_9BACT|nr:TOPRIM nucleotidyl transferase/hydrolase domain-containing protein [Spirosoma terrae]NDU96872.1 hypothetical protein [Spirosoma terrae]
MKYPQALTSKLDEIRSIVENWTIPIPFEEVVKWMMQFDNNDFELAYRIIKNLNIIGYEELKSALHIAYSKLERMSIDKGTKINSKNTLFAGIGDGGKSGAMIGYNFRISNELSEENFLDEDSFAHIEKGRIENLVLVDDIISTGNQAIKEIQKITETLIPLGVKNIFLLTAVGMKEGIKKVEKDTGAYVFSAFEYDTNDTIISFDSSFYDGLEFENRKNLKERLEYYGKICNPKSPLGYGGIGGLIVFFYNTPNSTIPHIWSTFNAWIPLFKRTLRINGIDSYYKQFDNLQSQKPKAKPGKEEITLFVEGKSEEIFFELILPKLKEAVNSDNITIISLGGNITEKLIENLNKSDTKYLFIIEDSPYASDTWAKRMEELFNNKPHIKIKPIIYYLDINAILGLETIKTSLKLPIIKEEDINSREAKKELEDLLFKSYAPPNRKRLLSALLRQYANNEELEKLISSISQALNKQVKKS